MWGWLSTTQISQRVCWVSTLVGTQKLPGHGNSGNWLLIALLEQGWGEPDDLQRFFASSNIIDFCDLPLQSIESFKISQSEMYHFQSNAAFPVEWNDVLQAFIPPRPIRLLWLHYLFKLWCFCPKIFLFLSSTDRAHYLHISRAASLNGANTSTALMRWGFQKDFLKLWLQTRCLFSVVCWLVALPWSLKQQSRRAWRFWEQAMQ